MTTTLKQFGWHMAKWTAAAAVSLVGTLTIAGGVAMVAGPVTTACVGLLTYGALFGMWSYNFGVWED